MNNTAGCSQIRSGKSFSKATFPNRYENVHQTEQKWSIFVQSGEQKLHYVIFLGI